jgi:hypothetical protein
MRFAALLLGLASFGLAFILLVDLGFMVSCFVSGGGTVGWRKFLHDATQAGPMAALVGWAAFVLGTGLLGSRMAGPARKATVASLASLLSSCGIMGAGVAAVVLLSLAGCRLLLSL